MTNIYFPDEEITSDDLYFICYMTERVARRLHQRNRYVVNHIGQDGLRHLISLANVLHAENPQAVEDRWIEDYHLQNGNVDVTAVDRNLAERIPTEIQMGKVYQRLIMDTMQPNEDYIDGMIRVYNNEICDKLDDYNCSAFYEPSYVVAEAYQAGEF